MSTTKDINGKESAKRKWAARYLWTALAMGVFYFISSIVAGFLGVKLEFHFPYEIWYGIAGGGFAMIGITIFEKKNQ